MPIIAMPFAAAADDSCVKGVVYYRGYYALILPLPDAASRLPPACRHAIAAAFADSAHAARCHADDSLHYFFESR